MKNKILTAVLCLTLVSLLSSCKKYEEGGPVRKAEKNLSTEWIMERATKNGSFVETVNENPQVGEVTEDWIFNEDGSMRTEDGEQFLYGTWELQDKKKVLQVTINSPASKASTISYNIVLLDENKMVWEHTYNGNSYRYELISAR